MTNKTRRVRLIKNKRFAENPVTIGGLLGGRLTSGLIGAFLEEGNDPAVGIEFDPAAPRQNSGFVAVVPVDLATINTINGIWTLLRNPTHALGYLKNLELAVSEKMAANGLKFSDDDLPDELLAGKGAFLPGPPPKDYIPRTKDHLLDKLLLEEEQKHQLNLKGTPKFVGYVDKEAADLFVKEGNIFAEDEQTENMALHGKNSHRLVFQIFREAIAQGDLKYLANKSQKELLSFFTETLLRTNDSIWSMTIDSVDDTTTNSETGDKFTYDELFDPKNFSNSCRSPNTLISLIMCFGKEFGLPNLQHCLLDSYWKQIKKMMDRVKAEDHSGRLKDLSNSDLYILCLKALCADGAMPGIVKPSLLTLSPQQAAQDSKYAQYDKEHHENIKRKPSSHVKTKSSNKSTEATVTQFPSATSPQNLGGGGLR